MGDLSQASPVSTSGLVNDFLQYKLSQKGHVWGVQPQMQKPSSLMKALRSIGDAFEAKNRSAFDEMFANLNITPDNAQETFWGVINELFCEGVTWGRLVAMFAFGGEMAIQSVENEMTVIVNSLAEWMTAYIDDHLTHWINDHGGWEGFSKFCHTTEKEEDPKSGLKVAAWGLAVGVIGALTVGAFLSK